MDQTDRRRASSLRAGLTTTLAALTGTGRRHEDRMLTAGLKLLGSSTALYPVAWACLRFVADKLGLPIPWEYVGAAVGGYAIKETGARVVEGMKVKYSSSTMRELTGEAASYPAAVSPVFSPPEEVASVEPEDLYPTKVRRTLRTLRALEEEKRAQRRDPDGR